MVDIFKENVVALGMIHISDHIKHFLTLQPYDKKH